MASRAPITNTAGLGGAVFRGRAGAVTTKVYFRGGPELAAALARIEKGMRDDLLKQATSAGAEVLAREWQSRIEATIGRGPGSAHYADAPYIRARAGKRGATAIVAMVKQPTEEGEDQPAVYAPKFEFGSRSTPAKPTLRPAVDAAKGQVVAAMEGELRALIAKATP